MNGSPQFTVITLTTDTRVRFLIGSLVSQIYSLFYTIYTRNLYRHHSRILSY